MLGGLGLRLRRVLGNRRGPGCLPSRPRHHVLDHSLPRERARRADDPPGALHLCAGPAHTVRARRDQGHVGQPCQYRRIDVIGRRVRVRHLLQDMGQSHRLGLCIHLDAIDPVRQHPYRRQRKPLPVRRHRSRSNQRGLLPSLCRPLPSGPAPPRLDCRRARGQRAGPARLARGCCDRHSALRVRRGEPEWTPRRSLRSRHGREPASLVAGCPEPDRCLAWAPVRDADGGRRRGALPLWGGVLFRLPRRSFRR
mmetsp:Transcript_37151/g.98856  ORF Transcript_37151/g.98856 Transcript_37151/m.98856 type:complete len:253 (+) Transcript_37151:598-1356(+)